MIPQNNFHSLGNSIVAKITKAFDGVVPQYGFLIGGGLGYESTKYLTNLSAVGDLDLFFLAEKLDDISALINNEELLTSIGFTFEGNYQYYPQDLDLFSQGAISIIRLSGKIDAIKVSINFCTSERLSYLYNDASSRSIYKIAHSKTYHVISSLGSLGTSLFVAMLPVDVTNLFNDACCHTIVTDKTYYKNGSSLHTGLITDFIAKGRIIRDFQDSKFRAIQNKISEQIVSHASPHVVETNAWSTLFASEMLFSKNYTKQLNYKFGELYKSLSNATKPASLTSARLVNNEFITVIDSQLLTSSVRDARGQLSASYNENEQSVSLEQLLTSDVVVDISILFEITNAAVKHVSKLLNHEESNPLIPSDLSIGNLAYKEQDLFYYDSSGSSDTLLQKLIDSFYVDMAKFASVILTADNRDRLKYHLLSIRLDTIFYLSKLYSVSLDTIKKETRQHPFYQHRLEIFNSYSEIYGY
ncbi:MAG: hypothetical protein KBC84_07190 [Proteobacteria bacterium]|nr:hypothetical protein [Pseudomonadota bacterium]